MFGHHQFERRQILNLAPLDHLAYNALQQALASATGPWTIQQLDIGNRNLGQGLPWMAGLPARLPSTRHPLAAWTAAQPIDFRAA